MLLPEFYQRNPFGEHVFILTLYPSNSGKTKNTVFINYGVINEIPCLCKTSKRTLHIKDRHGRFGGDSW